MSRWVLAILAVVLIACESAPELVPIPPPEITVDVEPAPPTEVAEPELDSEYVRAVVWVGRSGMGVLVHDCLRHGLLAATCEHVVDDMPHPVATLWPHDRLGSTVDAEVIATDEEEDVAILRLAVPAARSPRWTPSLDRFSEPEFGVGVVAVLPRDEAPTLFRSVMRQPTPKWFSVFADGEIRYGDSGSPVYDGAFLAGLVQGMFGPDHRYFYATTPEAVAEALRGVVGDCGR